MSDVPLYGRRGAGRADAGQPPFPKLAPSNPYPKKSFILKAARALEKSALKALRPLLKGLLGGRQGAPIKNRIMALPRFAPGSVTWQRRARWRRAL